MTTMTTENTCPLGCCNADLTPVKREVERTYEVTFEPGKSTTVRLRYEPGMEPADRFGEDAIADAVRRAKVLRKRKGKAVADAQSVDWLREQLVEARA